VRHQKDAAPNLILKFKRLKGASRERKISSRDKRARRKIRRNTGEFKEAI
jgi:hypothetical protein